jgi:hypothetical protein
VSERADDDGDLFAAINRLLVVSGFVVGMLIGLTGVGGGSLMTPIPVLLFGVHATTAIAFAVPADQPETTPRNDVGCRYWTLEIADPGGQRQAFRAEFVLPVFAAPLGTVAAVDAAAILAAKQHKQTDFQPSPKTRVRIAMAEEGGTAFALPRWASPAGRSRSRSFCWCPLA